MLAGGEDGADGVARFGGTRIQPAVGKEGHHLQGIPTAGSGHSTQIPVLVHAGMGTEVQGLETLDASRNVTLGI